MTPVRVGVVRYLNAVPLVEGLDACASLETIAAVPAKIAPMLEAGQIDLGLISVIDYARAATPLAMAPAGIIGCDGPTLTVRVFSRTPAEQIRTLAADTDSHASVALAQIILHHQTGRLPEVRDFDAREQVSSGSHEPWPETVLLIGDKVVTDSPPAVRYPYQIDLGQAWKDMTGLPFVYAIWMCRAEAAGDERVLEAITLLERQRLRNQARLDWIVSSRASARGWPDDLARQYLGEKLRFSCGMRERDAIALFLSKAAELGLAPARQPRFIEQPTLTL